MNIYHTSAKPADLSVKQVATTHCDSTSVLLGVQLGAGRDPSLRLQVQNTTTSNAGSDTQTLGLDVTYDFNRPPSEQELQNAQLQATMQQNYPVYAHTQEAGQVILADRNPDDGYEFSGRYAPEKPLPANLQTALANALSNNSVVVHPYQDGTTRRLVVNLPEGQGALLMVNTQDDAIVSPVVLPASAATSSPSPVLQAPGPVDEATTGLTAAE